MNKNRATFVFYLSVSFFPFFLSIFLHGCSTCIVQRLANEKRCSYPTDKGTWSVTDEDASIITSLLILTHALVETGIEQVQRSIGEKHEEFGRLELEEHNLEQRQLLYAAYDDVFERLLEYQQPLNLTETSQPPNDQSRQRRRDVFEQLMTSTSLVCRKIERLCTSPPSMPITTADGDTTTRIDATISPTKSRLLEQDIQHLLETQSSKSFLDSIATLLQRENNIPAMNENTLNRSPATDPTFQEKLEGIRQQQKDRLKHVLDLEQEALDWKLRVRSLETQLQEKTQACYKDPQIQAAFV